MIFQNIKTFCLLIVLIAIVPQLRADDYEYCPVTIRGHKLVYNHIINGTYVKLRIPEYNFFDQTINCIQIMDLKGSLTVPKITEGGYGVTFMELLIDGNEEEFEFEIQVYLVQYPNTSF
ncbi:uncharacterized protein [Diabrotica undecimpunctata]|uniref:uncharacterized protein n=1 Tax=Diabrotica undecimpunctata TaxID=50387 RepID=UPI003B6399DD